MQSLFFFFFFIPLTFKILSINTCCFQLKECYMSICDWKPLMDWSQNEENLIPSIAKDKYFWQNVRIWCLLKNNDYNK